MKIKKDELNIIKCILSHCDSHNDMIPTDELYELDVPGKRILYYLHKYASRGWINYGVNVNFGWLDTSRSKIVRWFGKQGIDLTEDDPE